jgi:hypothetical protein
MLKHMRSGGSGWGVEGYTNHNHRGVLILPASSYRQFLHYLGETDRNRNIKDCPITLSLLLEDNNRSERNSVETSNSH